MLCTGIYDVLVRCYVFKHDFLWLRNFPCVNCCNCSWKVGTSWDGVRMLLTPKKEKHINVSFFLFFLHSCREKVSRFVVGIEHDALTTTANSSYSNMCKIQQLSPWMANGNGFVYFFFLSFYFSLILVGICFCAFSRKYIWHCFQFMVTRYTVYAKISIYLQYQKRLFVHSYFAT